MVINHDSPITNEGFSRELFRILKWSRNQSWMAAFEAWIFTEAFGNIETWWHPTKKYKNLPRICYWSLCPMAFLRFTQGKKNEGGEYRHSCHSWRELGINVQLFDQFVDPFLLFGFDFWFPPREKWHVDCNLQQHFPAAHLFSLWICLCFQKGRPQRRCSDQKKAASRRMNSGPPKIAENHWDLKKTDDITNQTPERFQQQAFWDPLVVYVHDYFGKETAYDMFWSMFIISPHLCLQMCP